MRIWVVIVAAAAAWMLAGPAAAQDEPDVDCRPAAVSAARTAAAAPGADAQAIWEPLWQVCVLQGDGEFTPSEAAAVSLAYAGAAHSRGDDEACIDALNDYSPGRGGDTPAMAALDPRERARVRALFGQCHAWCQSTGQSAACATARVDMQREALVEAGFEGAPCEIDGVPGQSVALGHGRCLARLDPMEPFETATAEQKGAATVCGGFALYDHKGSRPLKGPERGWPTDVGLCCAEATLRLNPDGRISIEPLDNPPEHCLTGHRTDVLQVIVRLEGDRLVLVQTIGG
jgi:hypothetical protein